MEIISLKLEKEMLNNIDNCLKRNNYSTRTEFIRDSIRKNLEQMSKEEALHKLLELKGSVKTRITEKQYRKNREEAFEELLKEKGWKL